MAREKEDGVELSIYGAEFLCPDNKHCNASHIYETTSNDCDSVSDSVDCSVTNKSVDSVSDPLLFSNSDIYYECYSDPVSTLDFCTVFDSESELYCNYIFCTASGSDLNLVCHSFSDSSHSVISVNSFPDSESSSDMQPVLVLASDTESETSDTGFNSNTGSVLNSNIDLSSESFFDSSVSDSIHNSDYLSVSGIVMDSEFIENIPIILRALSRFVSGFIETGITVYLKPLFDI